jgi:hypothetical protein
VFLFKLRRVLLSGLKNLNGHILKNFDENGGFWVKMVKQIKKMHCKNRSVLLQGDEKGVRKAKYRLFKSTGYVVKDFMLADVARNYGLFSTLKRKFRGDTTAPSKSMDNATPSNKFGWVA